MHYQLTFSVGQSGGEGKWHEQDGSRAGRGERGSRRREGKRRGARGY